MTGRSASLIVALWAALSAAAVLPAEIQIFADGFNDGTYDAWACDGLECQQVTCINPSGTTSVSGTVTMPNGTLPLPNVVVYVPNAEVPPMPEGAQCVRCGDSLPGSPLVATTTNAAGVFFLDNVPAGSNVPLVIQTGKWRRQVTIANVPACEDTALAADETRLPKNQSEGDLPLIAVATGAADSLECLIRKLGVDDAEFTTSAGNGRIHLYAGQGGTDQFDVPHGSAALTASTTLWSDVAILSTYDLVALACEGNQYTVDKPAAALERMKQYADLGGRVYAGHWQNYWIQAAPDPWPSLGTWVALNNLNSLEVDVNQTFARGADLADWLLDNGASSTLGKVTLGDTRHTLQAIDETNATRWLSKSTTANGVPTVQYFSFTTPLEQPATNRCGRVLFSDSHPFSGDSSNSALAFPSGGCVSSVSTLTANEKVLAYMLFDVETCIGNNSE